MDPRVKPGGDEFGWRAKGMQPRSLSSDLIRGSSPGVTSHCADFSSLNRTASAAEHAELGAMDVAELHRASREHAPIGARGLR